MVQPIQERKTTILVVDDEPAIRLGLAVTIGRHGYHVITAEDGNDGIRKAKENLPALILSDVMMPPPDGFEMRKKMSADPELSAIPFIFLTARSGVDDRIAGMREGADDYITKPFITEELIARIDAVLRRVRTERERGREQVKAAAQEELEKIQREIMQNFRHELRTPLSNVVMSLEMAVNNKFTNPDEQGDFMRIALSSADRLEGLVSDMIALSDVDQAQVNNIRQPINNEIHILNPIFKRLQRYEHKKIEFFHDITTPIELTAPRREFIQALGNIMDNAFKFSPEHGKVTLTIKGNVNGGAVIQVQDEGPGIPEDQREKVFERFYQVSQGDNRDYQGLGVGLTISRAVFEAVGGSVKIVDSEKGCCVEAILADVKQEDTLYGRKDDTPQQTTG